jgi:hypothetical protein
MGWRKILSPAPSSGLLAQFGLRDMVHNWIVHLTHLQIPLQETGAFNLFAWQAVWVAGLWIGARSAMGVTPLEQNPRMGSGRLCLRVPVLHRHSPRLAGPLPDATGAWDSARQVAARTAASGQSVAFTVVVYWMRPILVRLIAIEPFLTLGKASLRVFCAHIFFVFVGLALLYQDVGEDGDGQIEQLHGFTAIALLVVTFAALILVAANEVRKRRAERAKKQMEQAEAEPPVPVLQ